MPYWDTGAPGLARLGDYLDRPAEPFNDHEPVDSSAAAIAAQGLLRLGNYLAAAARPTRAARYRQAGLTVARTLFAEPYLSTDPAPRGAAAALGLPPAQRLGPRPARAARCPAASRRMWGDYHARELALLILREAEGGPYLKFF